MRPIGLTGSRAQVYASKILLSVMSIHVLKVTPGAAGGVCLQHRF